MTEFSIPTASRGPHVALLVTLALFGTSVATPQLPASGFGLSGGALVSEPYGTLGHLAGRGYGAYLSARLDAAVVGLRATVELTRFGGPTERTILGAQVGPRLGAGPLKLGFDVGRYTDFSALGYTPNLSLAFGPLESGLGLTILPDSRWLTLSGGVRF